MPKLDCHQCCCCYFAAELKICPFICWILFFSLSLFKHCTNWTGFWTFPSNSSSLFFHPTSISALAAIIFFPHPYSFLWLRDNKIEWMQRLRPSGSETPGPIASPPLITVWAGFFHQWDTESEMAQKCIFFPLTNTKLDIYAHVLT